SQTASAHLFGVTHQFIEMNFRSGDKSADPAAALHQAFALERGKGMASGHQADIMNSSEFSFGGHHVSGAELASVNVASNLFLDPFIRRDSICLLGQHSRFPRRVPDFWWASLPS